MQEPSIHEGCLNPRRMSRLTSWKQEFKGVGYRWFALWKVYGKRCQTSWKGSCYCADQSEDRGKQSPVAKIYPL